MEYSEAANYLVGLPRFGSTPGTASVRRLLSELGDPHERVPCVQIAGSNGKGSTARMLASVLEAQGSRVGLYTSPHLDDLRERVRVNGRRVPRRAVTDFVAETRPLLTRWAGRGERLTRFEALTALALWHFADRNVDVAVLEVGIGGRYDATSVVDPVASAVTSVSLEHTDVLGDTLADVARDMAHVVPRDRPLVTAAREVSDVFRESTDVLTVGSDPDDDVRIRVTGRPGPAEQAIDVAGPDWSVTATVPHPGVRQAENAAVAAALSRQVADADPDTIAEGLRRSEWPGRFELVGRDPLVVLDGAHNPGAAEHLATVMGDLDPEEWTLVFGAMDDKDWEAMVEALPRPARVVTCRPDEGRAADPAVLAEAFRAADVPDVEAIADVESAVDAALSRAGPDDAVLVTGSLATVAEARHRWTRTVVPKTARLAREADGTGLPVALDGTPQSRERRVTVKTRLQRSRARRVQTALLRAGGECRVSDLQGRFVDVLLEGTADQFGTVADSVEATGTPSLAADLRDALAPPSRTLPDPLGDGPVLMGVLNVTPDSFHDGGAYDTTAAAVDRAERLVDAGADIVDVGGESTRPGADPTPAATQRERVLPVVEELASLDAAVSVDTRDPSVAAAALDAGADLVNDVSGLADPEMRSLVAEAGVPVVVTHSVDAPVDPDDPVRYDDVVEDVVADLRERLLLAERAGVDRERVVVDPGIGFGKSPRENAALVDRLCEFRGLGCPVLVGHSHKSLVAASGDSLGVTVAGTALAVERGAGVVRVHDAPENIAAVRTALAVSDAE